MKIIHNFNGEQLIGKTILPFLRINPHATMYPRQEEGDVWDAIPETKIMDKWKKFFVKKDIPFFIEQQDNALILWKKQETEEEMADAKICLNWFEEE